MNGSRIQKVWFFQKCISVGVVLLLNGFVYTPVVCADDVDDNLIFIHHSVGQNWLSHSLHAALLVKDYIDERNDIYYNSVVSSDIGRPGSLGSIPGNKTNMNHWVLWFNDYFEGVKNHGCADGFNKIIMFKSCYSISDIVADGTEPGDPFAATYPSGQTIVNYKAVYRHPSGPGNTYSNGGYTYYPLEDVFALNPNILFIPVTAPPLHQATSTNPNAHRARMFNDWLTNTWLSDYNNDNPGLNNVAPYYWFNLLAYPDTHPDHPNRLKTEYDGASGNSHPNDLANRDSTEDFATNLGNFIDTAWNAFVTGHVNNPPYNPSNPSPSDDVTDIDINTDLSWNCSDPDGNDLTYNIYFEKNNSTHDELVSNNQSENWYDPGTLEYNTHYYWQIVAWDNYGESSSGSIWNFTTENNISPEISNVIAYPNPQLTGGYVNISCDVTDNDGIDIVKVNITDPNGGTVNVTMIGGDYYNTTYELNGSYCYFIWTNDTLGNENMSTSYQFEIGDYLHVNNPFQKWNFISLPFNQSIDKKDLIIVYNGASYNWTEAIDPANGPLVDSFIFGWNRGPSGQIYQAVDVLEPGYGYWMYAYSDCELWTSGISVPYDNLITNIEQKWNTIGIPYYQSVDKTNLTIHYNGTDYSWTEAIDPANGLLIDSFIFGWNRGPSGQIYQAVDTLEPGYSYCMYAYYDCTLQRS